MFARHMPCVRAYPRALGSLYDDSSDMSGQFTCITATEAPLSGNPQSTEGIRIAHSDSPNAIIKAAIMYGCAMPAQRGFRCVPGDIQLRAINANPPLLPSIHKLVPSSRGRVLGMLY